MIRFLLTLALLWPFAANAAAPTVSNTGQCTSALGVSTLACAVTTTGTNKIVSFTIATQNTSSTARTVSSITDAGGAGLVPVLAPGAGISATTVCLGGAINPCSLNLEQWWVLAPTALVAEAFTVNLSGSSTVVIGGWRATASVFNTAAPYDTNATLAAKNSGGSASIPTAGNYITSSTDDLLVFDTVVGRNQTGWVPCFLTYTNWNASFAEISFTSQIELTEEVQGVTATQSQSGVPLATVSSSCPGGTSTASGDGWLSLATAMNGNGVASTCSGYKALKGVGCK